MVLRLERPEGAVREQRARPGPEVLRREVATGDLAQVVIDVVGRDVADDPIVVDVLEELLPGQLLASPDDCRETPVPQADLVHDPGLAPEPEPDLRTADRRVAGAQGRQPE